MKLSETIAGKLPGTIKDLPGRITERADQVLLGLSHSKQSIPLLLRQTLQRIESNPSDLVGRVSKQVLERAETVRKQLLEKAEASDARWVPEWLKDVSFVRTSAEAVLVEAKPARAKKSLKKRTTKNATAPGGTALKKRAPKSVTNNRSKKV